MPVSLFFRTISTLASAVVLNIQMTRTLILMRIKPASGLNVRLASKLDRIDLSACNDSQLVA